MLIKQKNLASEELASGDFWQLANKVLNKVKSTIPPLCNDLMYCFQLVRKQSCLLKAFLRTLILMTQVSPYLLSLLGVI